MDTYLLLRSNKKTGPYNLDQLVNFGLKPYDLVWVEGKSAAWRYPSEVEVLKAYAPAVEEQPFDRFFKKAVGEKPLTKQKPVGEQPVELKPVPTTKNVFVSMPDNVILQKPNGPVKPKPIIDERPKAPSDVVAPATINEALKEKQSAPVNVEPTLDEKYSESLEDIKKRYTETYLNRKKRSGWTSTHTAIVQVFGGAVFFCLLVVLAYRNFAGNDMKEKERITVITPDRKPNNNTQVSNTLPSLLPNNENISTQANTNSPVTVKNTPGISNERITPTETKKDNVNIERQEKLKEESIPEKKAVMPRYSESKREEIKAKSVSQNIRNLVNVKANNYKQRAFGGVLNLELTVNNNSRFELDKVTVELQYLKPSEQPIKTETIVFSSVSPNGSQTLKIPDYLRGVKVSYRITGIESAQYENDTAGL